MLQLIKDAEKEIPNFQHLMDKYMRIFPFNAFEVKFNHKFNPSVIVATPVPERIEFSGKVTFDPPDPAEVLREILEKKRWSFVQIVEKKLKSNFNIFIKSCFKIFFFIFKHYYHHFIIYVVFYLNNFLISSIFSIVEKREREVNFKCNKWKF